MSDASQSHDSNRSRYLRSDEKDLIRMTLGSSICANLDDLKVVDADDGGMGGVRFETNNPLRQVFGSELARLDYVDTDGVPVSITLNSDSNGDLFEIDFWKADFSPLAAYPTRDRLSKVEL